MSDYSLSQTSLICILAVTGSLRGSGHGSFKPLTITDMQRVEALGSLVAFFIEEHINEIHKHAHKEESRQQHATLSYFQIKTTIIDRQLMLSHHLKFSQTNPLLSLISLPPPLHNLCISSSTPPLPETTWKEETIFWLLINGMHSVKYIIKDAHSCNCMLQAVKIIMKIKSKTTIQFSSSCIR